jgi:hypothetical protein
MNKTVIIALALWPLVAAGQTPTPVPIPGGPLGGTITGGTISGTNVSGANVTPTGSSTPQTLAATAATANAAATQTALSSETTRAQAAEALLAPLASPVFTGNPTVPGYLTTSGAAGTYAPLASPALIGTPTVPTAAAGTSTTQAASTAFTTGAVATETTRATTAEGLLAPLASPAFSGTPTAPAVRVGNLTGWPTALIPTISESNATISSVSPTGSVGAMGACRTSDAISADCLAAMGFALNDNTTTPHGSWAGYFESRRYAGASNAIDAELDMVNLGSVVVNTPWSFAPSGISPDLWLSCGRPDISGSVGCTDAIGVVNNGAVFEKGIVFEQNALDATQGGIAPGGIAFEMANGQQFHWVYNDGAAGASITSTVTGGANYAQGLVFTNSGLEYENSAGTPLLTVNTLNTDVDGITIVPATAGGTELLEATGSDTNIPLAIRSKGAGQIYLQGGASTAVAIETTNNTANYLGLWAATTGNAPAISALGSDTNINLSLNGKGTGAVTTATPVAGDNSTKIATTAFDTAAVGVETSRATTAEGLLAPKVSPTFSGTVTIPTIITTLATPASSSAPCAAGQIGADASYVYVCTATNTWKRAPISTW